MSKTDAQRAASVKWDAKNMKNVACKVKKEKADAFRKACLEQGTTPAAVLSKAIDDFLEKVSKNS